MESFVYVDSIEGAGASLECFDVGIVDSSSDNGAVVRVFFLRAKEHVEINASQVTKFDPAKTGDEFSKKVCDRCLKLLDTINDFSNNRIKKDNFVTKRPSCKACRKVKDGSPIPAVQRRNWNREKPKPFTPFTCPICLKTTIAGISKIVLDHNHQTGDARGWICESCNTGIGRFDDDPEILQRAIRWLDAD